MCCLTDISARDIEAIVREHQLHGVRIPGTNMVRTDVTRDSLANGTGEPAPTLPKTLTRS